MSQFETDKNFTEIKNHKMIGKTITKWVTGLEVQATVTRVWENEYSIYMQTIHEPVQWGDDHFTNTSVSIRKWDNWIRGTEHLTASDFYNV